MYWWASCYSFSSKNSSQSTISACFPSSRPANIQRSGIRGAAGILCQLSVWSSLAHHWQPHTLTHSKHNTPNTHTNTVGLFFFPLSFVRHLNHLMLRHSAGRTGNKGSCMSLKHSTQCPWRKRACDQRSEQRAASIDLFVDNCGDSYHISFK